MRSSRSFDEIRVYAGTAERTGVHFDRNEIRKSARFCINLSALIRKVRSIGDGMFYLPIDIWPGNVAQVNLTRPWIVLHTHLGRKEPSNDETPGQPADSLTKGASEEAPIAHSAIARYVVNTPDLPVATDAHAGWHARSATASILRRGSAKGNPHS